MTISNKIEGVLTLTTPLHCASTDDSLKISKTGKTTETPTMQRKIITRSGMEQVPYFPGNDLRGRLRRKAANLVLSHITAKDKVKIELYQGLNCASVSGQPDGSSLSVEEVIRARDNVYMGLFGGGARMLRSRYQVNDLLPVLRSTIEAGAVPESYGEAGSDNFFVPTYKPKDVINGVTDAPVKGFQLVQLYQMIRFDDVMRVARIDELEKYIQDYKQSTLALQLENIDKRIEREKEKDKAKEGEIRNDEIVKKSTVENMFSIQSIVTGTPMHFLLDFNDDVNDAHVGLMLLALRDLVREQALGGWSRAGLGKFKANLVLTRNNEPVKVFDDNLNAANATLSNGAQKLADTAIDAMGNLTADDMMHFFISRTDSPEALARKEKNEKKDKKTADKTPEAA